MENTTTTRTTEREPHGPGRCTAQQAFAGADHPFRCRGGFAHSFDHSYEPDDHGMRRVFSHDCARGRLR